MESSSEIIARSRRHFNASNYVDSLKILGEVSSQPVTEYTKENQDYLEYEIFRDVGKRSVNSDSKITFLFASLISASEIKRYYAYYAQALFDLAEASESLFYYKKASTKARKALSFLDFSNDKKDGYKKKLSSIIQDSRVKIKNLKKNASMPINFQQEAREWNGNEELKAYWEGLSLPFRKNLMKISVEELKNYVNGDQQTLIEVLKTVKKRQKWKVWICRSCSQKFSTSEACYCHIEEHTADFKPSLREDVSWIKQVWADSHSISVGRWKPVDVVACVQMINTHFEDVKVFVYKDGWCEDWSVTKDSERGSLLQEIRLLFLSLIKHKVLSDSFIDWVMHLVVKQLEKLGVSKEKIIDCHLEETPQSICFLEGAELRKVLFFLRKIMSRCTRVDDVKNIVCRTVDSFCQSTRVNERIDFDSQFSFILLDKRLLQGTVDIFDDEGTVKICDPARHCAGVHPRGDYLVTWLNDYFAGEGDDFWFPEPIHNHNFHLWMALMRALQFTSKNIVTKCAKKASLLESSDLTEEDKEKAALLDSKIVLCWTQRDDLLNDLTRVAFFDYRYYLLPPVKAFLLYTLRRRRFYDNV